MAGGETIKQSEGPMTTSDEIVGAWISKMEEFIDQGRQPVIVDYPFRKSGEKTVFIILPKETTMDDLVEVGRDEKMMRFCPENGGPSNFANPFEITESQAERLQATGLVQ